MGDQPKPRPSEAEIFTWLGSKFDGAVVELTPLSGGFWSSAFGFRVGVDELVLRLSDLADGFTADAAAMRFTGPDLPVPEITETGSALDMYYAISRRHTGNFVETTQLKYADAVGNSLASLLAALRNASADEPVFWYKENLNLNVTWHSWLRSGLIDDPTARVSGWRRTLEANPRYDSLFRGCESRIEELLPACPERRDLVHGDLLHQNVLVSDDASKVTAIFSWKCSVRGDFLFDAAWCTFWGPWHPAIAKADIWGRTLTATDLSGNDLMDASARHHCYELQIAASHLGWCAWTGNDHDLAAVADAAEMVLERGPLSAGDT